MSWLQSKNIFSSRWKLTEFLASPKCTRHSMTITEEGTPVPVYRITTGLIFEISKEYHQLHACNNLLCGNTTKTGAGTLI
eukprot:142994-Ditylum_brightwellii.AAC.1